MSLLQIGSTPVNPRLPSPVTILFNRLARGLLPTFSRHLIMCDNNDNNCVVLRHMQPQWDNETKRNRYSHKDMFYLWDQLYNIKVGNHGCMEQYLGTDQKIPMEDVTRVEWWRPNVAYPEQSYPWHQPTYPLKIMSGER